jgi:hypothetical protein
VRARLGGGGGTVAVCAGFAAPICGTHPLQRLSGDRTVHFRLTQRPPPLHRRHHRHRRHHHSQCRRRRGGNVNVIDWGSCIVRFDESESGFLTLVVCFLRRDGETAAPSPRIGTSTRASRPLDRRQALREHLLATDLGLVPPLISIVLQYCLYDSLEQWLSVVGQADLQDDPFVCMFSV